MEHHTERGMCNTCGMFNTWYIEHNIERGTCYAPALIDWGHIVFVLSVCRQD